MRYFRFFYLLLGAGLLLAVLSEVDIEAVWMQSRGLGWSGLTLVLFIYLVAFLFDTQSWQLALPAVKLSRIWLRRLFVVRMVGEAFNNVTPMAGMGGEPVKAVLLKKFYQVNYGDSVASLILARTTNVIALLVFLTVGFYLLMQAPEFAASPFKTIAATGLGALASGVVLFFLIQRYRLSSIASDWLSRWRVGKVLEGMLHPIYAMDDRLVRFYTRHHARFATALVLALLNWLLGVLEVYVTLLFLGWPVSWQEAWIIESMTQLVRAGTFFIPANLGAQEGVFMLVCGVITGNPNTGLAVALVRRCREVLWIAIGLVLGWSFSLKPGAINSVPESESTPN